MKAAAAGTILLIAASCSSSPAPGADASPLSSECAAIQKNRPASYAALDFFGMLTVDLHINYRLPTSLEEMLSKADRVALGRLSAVEQGNTYGGPRCSRAMHTSNLVFQVDRELRSDGRAKLVVEQVHVRAVMTEELAAKIPRNRMLVFADDVRKYPAMPGADGGVPGPEQDLYYLLSPQGLLVEADDGQLGFPLEPERERWLDVSSLTMDAVVERLTQ